MVIHDFDGTPIDIPDEGEIDIHSASATGGYVFRVFDERNTCRFHMEKGGVMCEKKKRLPDSCDRCGWNPRVAHRRAFQIRKKIYEMEENEQKDATD